VLIALRNEIYIKVKMLFLSFVVDLTTLSVTQRSNDRMVVNCDVETMCNKLAMV